MNQSPEDPTLGKTKALEFITGYFLEYSLSVDNLFVFIMVFQKFRITPQYQPLILKWGNYRSFVLPRSYDLHRSGIGFSVRLDPISFRDFSSIYRDENVHSS
ncbi:integral membrane protein TerC domain protein [Leptospira weilii str. 2006001855]|uniref:Integral membrane protein TerC domain protein n=1 Tax=Leptospira weilii str. 2006001855 TaxID=996804 RepID=M6FWI7_9LEPT|nr:integral membrane protein TerC domain protein [Leptospira weilii str. 2006001855]